MVELLPPVTGLAHKAIENMLKSLENADTRLPPWVLVEDRDDAWQRHAALLPVEERRRSVIAASSQASLADAIRFEIGGATWLPVSTPSLELACEAAAIGDLRIVAPIVTRDVLEMSVADATELWGVMWRPRSFWNTQLGAGRLCSWLTGIADRLECVAAILPGPVLVVADRGRDEIEIAWRDESVSGGTAFPVPPAIVDLLGAMGSEGSRSRLEYLLAGIAGEGGGEPPHVDGSLPVLEIPSGLRVGCWSPSPRAKWRESGWLAVPHEKCPDWGSWYLFGEDGSRETVVDSISPADEEAADQSVIRVPGWIGAELRRGSPAGLIVERLARHEARTGRPLWVPSVDAEGVQFLLGLPGPIWVDGPGVPG